jgi:hypothetical protein
MTPDVLRLLAAVLLLALLPGSARAAERARSADAFVDSVGVNVHATYGDTAYGDWDRTIGDLRWLGVRHVRDGLKVYPDTAYDHWEFDRFHALAAAGIRVTAIMAWPGSDQGTPETLLGAVRGEVGDAVEALEGPNEYDMRGEPDWPAKLRAYQQRLWTLAKADPATARLPVLAPSLTSWQARAAVGDVGAWADAGNLHPYPAGAAPEASGVEREIEQARWLKPSGPLQVTETGYHGALAQPGGQTPVSDAVAAVYLPRLLLDDFSRGIARTFLYELLDEKPDAAGVAQEQHWGLFDVAHRAKPQARTLQRLLALLADPGPRFAPAGLDYALDAPADVRHLLLQKRDGSFALVLWRAVPVWDAATRRPLAAAPEAAAVTLATPRDAQVHSLAGATGASARTSRVSVAVGPSPVVLTLRAPASAPPPPFTLGARAQLGRRAVTLRARCGAAASCRVTLGLRVRVGRSWRALPSAVRRVPRGAAQVRVAVPARLRARLGRQSRARARASVTVAGYRGSVRRAIVIGTAGTKKRAP